MENLIKKSVLAGLGAMSLTLEKAEEITKMLIEKGEVSEREETNFVKDLMNLAEKNRAGIEKKIEKAVEKALKKMDIPTRREINELKEEISKLAKNQQKVDN